MRNSLIIGAAACLVVACQSSPQVQWVQTTPQSALEQQVPLTLTKSEGVADVIFDTGRTDQTINGFGGCFNELGWTTLSALKESDRQAIIQDLFSSEGMNFTIGRMPVGANDFARGWYSYDETPGDFALEHFSIDNDRQTLIPYIKAAMDVNPNLYIWASPWSPPTWMKYNKHYACRPDANVNDLQGDPKQNLEGTNMFIQEPEYFKTYTSYFRRFVESYRQEGINIRMVAPQNEFNSCQNFPSCTWTAAGLATFMGDYLGPAMKDMGVDLMFGTMERANTLLIDTIMQSNAAKYISKMGFQWAGKGAIGAVHHAMPNMPLWQTESECGNGENSWDYCFYIAGLMKHYFEHGASTYMYWNISLDIRPGQSPWKWPQNSLISVDTERKTWRYNPEYYLMKHFSHYVQPNAVRLVPQGKKQPVLAFANPDGTVVLVAYNATANPLPLRVQIDKAGSWQVELTVAPQSIQTYVVPMNTIN